MTDTMSVAVVDDAEVVEAGVAEMLAPYSDRVAVYTRHLSGGFPPVVDVALYDVLARSQHGEVDRRRVLNGTRARHLVGYSWEVDPQLLSGMTPRGVDAWIPKALGAKDLVVALEEIRAGERAVVRQRAYAPAYAGDWPGQEEGLTERESGILTAITHGRSNNDIAAEAYLSLNTVKSYIRSCYRKMGVLTRSEAILWCLDHGFEVGLPEATVIEG